MPNCSNQAIATHMRDPSAIKTAVQASLNDFERSVAQGFSLYGQACRFALRQRQLIEQIFMAFALMPAQALAPRLAIVGTGSLARGVMSPYADLDLLFLVDDFQDEQAVATATDVLYALWDAQITIGHAVRTPQETVALSLCEDTVLTTLFDWVKLAGADVLSCRLSACIRGALERNRFNLIMCNAIEQWQKNSFFASPGDRSEPNIKSGAGGLRTIDEACWAAHMVWGKRSWAELAERGIITITTHGNLCRIRKFLIGIRTALHLACGSRQDVFLRELQKPLIRYNYDVDGLLPKDQFSVLNAVHQSMAAAHAIAGCILGAAFEEMSRRCSAEGLRGSGD